VKERSVFSFDGTIRSQDKHLWFRHYELRKNPRKTAKIMKAKKPRLGLNMLMPACM